MRVAGRVWPGFDSPLERFNCAHVLRTCLVRLLLARVDCVDPALCFAGPMILRSGLLAVGPLLARGAGPVRQPIFLNLVGPVQLYFKMVNG